MPHERLRPDYTFDEDRLTALREIAPEAFADGKVNWAALKEALGGELEDDETDEEHFGLFWPGKREARKLASRPSSGTLVPVKGEGVNEESTRNIFIEGENLEVLKILRKSYAGRVKMIYIDPPYNTGNDFVYDDDFTEPLQDYLRRTGQIDGEGRPMTTNKKADGRFHSKWLSMMYPRLRLARELLRDDGVIFVSIDDNEVHHLRMLMNEVFGEENFVTSIHVQMSTVQGQKVRAAKGGNIVKNAELILVYKMNGTKDIFSRPLLDPSGYDNHYSIWFETEKYGFKITNLIDKIKNNVDLTEEIKYLGLKNNIKELYEYSPKVRNFIIANAERIARAHDTVDVPEEVVTRIPNGYSIEYRTQERNYFVGKNKDGKPVQYILLSEKIKNADDYYSTLGPTTLRGDWWSGFYLDMGNISKEGGVPFPNGKKPVRLIRQIVEAMDFKNEIVLDFFAGSGSTAEAIYQAPNNNRFVLVQLPEEIEENTENKNLISIVQEHGFKNRITEITKIRLRKSVEDFKVLKLTSSHYKPWQNYHGESVEELESLFESYAEPLVENWREIEDGLFTEILLLEGFPLDSTVAEMTEYSANRLRRVTCDYHENRLIVCLDDALSPETVQQLDLTDGDTFVCLDTAVDDKTKARLADKGLIKTI